MLKYSLVLIALPSPSQYPMAFSPAKWKPTSQPGDVGCGKGQEKC